MSATPKSAGAPAPAAGSPVLEPPEPTTPTLAPMRDESAMYEVTTETWGSQPPIYRKGDTFTPDQLPDRDLAWAELQGVIARLPNTDPRLAGDPSGPTGDQTGVPSDGWISRQSPEAIPPALLNQLVEVMRRNGGTAGQIAALMNLGGAPPATHLPAPIQGQGHTEVPAGTSLTSTRSVTEAA